METPTKTTVQPILRALPADEDRCAAQLPKDRGRCKRKRLDGKPYCAMHDEDRREERLRYSAQGVALARENRLNAIAARQAGLVPHPLRNMSDVFGLLETIVGSLLTMPPSIAREKTLIAAINAAGRLVEVGVLESRVRSLEEAIHASVKGTASKARSVGAEGDSANGWATDYDSE